MVITGISLPEATTAEFKTKCEGWLERAKQQEVLARAMVTRIHEMRARAAEMRKPPNPWLVHEWTLSENLLKDH